VLACLFDKFEPSLFHAALSSLCAPHQFSLSFPQVSGTGPDLRSFFSKNPLWICEAVSTHTLLSTGSAYCSTPPFPLVMVRFASFPWRLRFFFAACLGIVCCCQTIGQLRISKFFYCQSFPFLSPPPPAFSSLWSVFLPQFFPAYLIMKPIFFSRCLYSFFFQDFSFGSPDAFHIIRPTKALIISSLKNSLPFCLLQIKPPRHLPF